MSASRTAASSCCSWAEKCGDGVFSGDTLLRQLRPHAAGAEASFRGTACGGD